MSHSFWTLNLTIKLQMCTGKFSFCPESGAYLEKKQLPHHGSSQDIPPRIRLVISQYWNWVPRDRPSAEALFDLIEHLLPVSPLNNSAGFQRSPVPLSFPARSYSS